MNATMTSRFLRTMLLTLDAFLAFTVIAGGIGLLTGFNAPPVDLLAGSPFETYTLPGLALLVFVGGSAALAVIMTWRNNRSSSLASLAAGAMIIVFELVEILTIGSPAGIARNLQVFYLVLGILIVTLAFTKRRADHNATAQL